MTNKKTYALTLRLDEETGKLFTAIVSLNGTTATEVLRDYVNKYIESNKRAAIAAIEKLIK